MRKRKGAVILALAMMLLLVPVMAQAGTWRQNYIGWWWQEADGSWPSNEWKSINGNWYLFDADGYIRYGWYWDGTNWYYLGGKSDGAMKTGWQVVNGNWYYMYKDGRMAVCGSRMQSKASGSSLETGGGIAIRTEVIQQITGKPLIIRSIILTKMAGCRPAGRRSMESGIIWDQQVVER